MIDAMNLVIILTSSLSLWACACGRVYVPSCPMDAPVLSIMRKRTRAHAHLTFYSRDHRCEFTGNWGGRGERESTSTIIKVWSKYDSIEECHTCERTSECRAVRGNKNSIFPFVAKCISKTEWMKNMKNQKGTEIQKIRSDSQWFIRSMWFAASQMESLALLPLPPLPHFLSLHFIHAYRSFCV